MNYTLRPSFSWVSSTHALAMWEEEYVKHADPETWAARKIQRLYQNRKVRAERQDADALEEANEHCGVPASGDSKRLGCDERYRRRKERAEEKLRGLVKTWRERRQRSLAGKGSIQVGSAEASSKSRSETLTTAHEVLVPVLRKDRDSIGAHLLRASGRRLKDCEVTRAVRKIGRQISRTEADMIPHVHRLVTLNWIEDLDDVHLISDRQWEAWNIPEKVVVQLKSEAYEALEERLSGNIGKLSVRVSEAMCGWF